MRRRAALWVLVGWLLAVGIDQLIGYEYTVAVGSSAHIANVVEANVRFAGWEPVPYVSLPQATNGEGFVFLRRHRWRDWLYRIQWLPEWFRGSKTAV